MSRRAARAEAARKRILASGNRELIDRLALLDAAAGRAPRRARASRSAGRGPELLATGLSVAGGAWLGTVLAGVTMDAAMRRAFAEVAAGLDLIAEAEVDAASDWSDIGVPDDDDEDFADDADPDDFDLFDV